MSRDALVVGIGKYKCDGLPKLNASRTDAEAIARILEKYGEFNIHQLPAGNMDNNIDISLSQLQKALVELFKPEGRQIPDTALFYFSGYGLRQDLGVQEIFLATSDVFPESSFNGLSIQWLLRLLQESPVPQQIIWLDCCFTGPLVDFSQEAPVGQGQIRDLCFMGAARKVESASSSVVTQVLQEGLDPQRSPQEWITNYSLADYLNNNLHNSSQKSIFTNFGQPINLTRTSEAAKQPAKIKNVGHINPYKGLRYFDFTEEDAQYFYGREQLSDRLIDRVRQSNFVAILGASGSGKSSVLRAGLLYQLQQGYKLPGSQHWKIQIMLPGEHPLDNLAQSFLDPAHSDVEKKTQIALVKSLLTQGIEGLTKLVQAAPTERVILVIDQFEEVFTLCQDLKEREQFFKFILGALKQNDQKLCLILTMKADFLVKCLEREYNGLGQKIQDNLVTVTPMNQKQLRDAITKPAAKARLMVEDELVEQILIDIKSLSGSLPLLEYTLTELWQQKTSNCLEFKTYNQLGGISGALNQRASQVYQQLETEEQQAAKHIFLSLNQWGEGVQSTCRRVLQRDFVTAQYGAKLIDEVLHKLAAERLIITSKQVNRFAELSRSLVPRSSDDREQNQDRGKKTETEQVVVNIAHEALILHWQQLRDWLEESRDSIRKQKKVDILAQRWQENAKKPDYLLQGKRLQEMRDFQSEYAQDYPLSNLAIEFIQESIKTRRVNLLKSIGIFLVVPLLGIVSTGYFLAREAILNSAFKTVRNCEGEEYCQGRIKALEKLAQAKRSFRSLQLDNANLEDANLEDAYFYSINLEDANIEGANLRGAYLYGSYLKGANLKGANLEEAKLKGVNFRGANLYGAKLKGANLKGANLQNARLQGANLYGAHLYGAHLQGANLQGTYLKGTYLYDAYLKSANLQGANLQDASLQDAHLQGANLQGANLQGANLQGTNLQNTNFYRANLKGANLTNTNNLTNQQIKLACNWETAIYVSRWDKEQKKWIVNSQEHQKRLKQLKQDRRSNPRQPPDCSKWK